VGKSTAFFTNQHFQFLINWLLSNKENKLLHPFHVVPLAVLAQVTNLFEGKLTEILPPVLFTDTVPKTG
jgi:hypothetical protein